MLDTPEAAIGFLKDLFEKAIPAIQGGPARVRVKGAELSRRIADAIEAGEAAWRKATDAAPPSGLFAPEAAFAAALDPNGDYLLSVHDWRELLPAVVAPGDHCGMTPMALPPMPPRVLRGGGRF